MTSSPDADASEMRFERATELDGVFLFLAYHFEKFIIPIQSKRDCGHPIFAHRHYLCDTRPLGVHNLSRSSALDVSLTAIVRG